MRRIHDLISIAIRNELGLVFYWLGRATTQPVLLCFPYNFVNGLQHCKRTFDRRTTTRKKTFISIVNS